MGWYYSGDRLHFNEVNGGGYMLECRSGLESDTTRLALAFDVEEDVSIYISSLGEALLKALGHLRAPCRIRKMVTTSFVI